MVTTGSPAAEAAETTTGTPELIEEPAGDVKLTVGSGGVQVTDLVARALLPNRSTTVAVIS